VIAARRRVVGHYWGFAALLALVLTIANVAADPGFASPSNWAAELAIFAPLALLAVASMPAIVSGGGGIDISIGPLAVLCNVVLVNSLFAQGVTSAWVTIPIVLAVGGVVGALNGTLAAYLRFQPVIATLCSFFIISGVTVKLAGAAAAVPSGNWTASLGAKIGPVPGAVVLVGAVCCVWAALQRTAYLRNLFAVGGNDVTAFSAGVNVAGVRLLAYALGGLFAAIAAIAITASLQASQPVAGPGYIVIALAAVALGGTPFTGGRGGLVGSLLGAFCLYLIQTLLQATNVPPTWLQVVYGVLVFVGVLLTGRAFSRRRQ
jgi:ribose transport system permease protein